MQYQCNVELYMLEDDSEDFGFTIESIYSL